MIERRNLFCVIFALVMCANFRHSWQLRNNKTSTCTKSSSEVKLQNFWREVNSHCAKDPYNLIDVYEQINSGVIADKWSSLLSKNVQKSLIDTCAQTFEGALLSNNFRNNADIDRLAKYIVRNSLISDAVFEQFVDAVYLYMDKSELASNLFSNKNLPQIVTSLLHLNSKFITRADFDPRFTGLMAFYLRRIQYHEQFPALSLKLKPRVLKTVEALPTTLRKLYFSKTVSLLNIGQWEYVNLPYETVVSSKQRSPVLTWLLTKNDTDISDLAVEFDDNGKIAFTSIFEDKKRFMYIDGKDQKVYFLLNQEGEDDTRWWQVEYYEDFVAFKDPASKQLMCSDEQYDAFFRRVSLATQSSEFDVALNCRWAVNSVSKLD